VVITPFVISSFVITSFVINCFIITCFIIACAAVPALAQGARAQRPAARGAQPAAEGVSPAEIQQMFDAYVLMQAQDVLQLRDDQYPRFLSRLRALQAARRRAEMQRLQNINQLRRILQSGDLPSEGMIKNNEAMIKERLKALDDLAASSAAEVKQAMDSIDEVLDLRQQARFRVLEEEMERKKVDLVSRTRQANRPNANRPRVPQP
jgi:hypothetical protein